jgi:hypothetical protein
MPALVGGITCWKFCHCYYFYLNWRAHRLAATRRAKNSRYASAFLKPGERVLSFREPIDQLAPDLCLISVMGGSGITP